MYALHKTKSRQETKPTFTINVAALTAPGEQRPVNQDVVFHRGGQVEIYGRTARTNGRVGWRCGLSDKDRQGAS